MARQRVLTGPAYVATTFDDKSTPDAPTIPEMKSCWGAICRDGVRICRMIYQWRSNGGAERDLDDPETWDRYLASVFGLAASNVRGMFTQGHALCSLQLQQTPDELQDVRTSHLRALAPLRHDPDLVGEAWVSANERAAQIDDDRDRDPPGRLTAELLKQSVNEIRTREGLCRIGGDGGNRVPCEVCSGKGWTYRSIGDPVPVE